MVILSHKIIREIHGFRDGDKVATIITGDKVEFTSDCKGICNYSVDDKEVVHLTLPLGKYKVKEVKTLYGYVFPEKNEWNLEFTWKNGRDEFVLNSTSDTNDKGELNLHNKLARPQIQLLKEDADTKQPIRGAVFGLYTNMIFSMWTARNCRCRNRAYHAYDRDRWFCYFGYDAAAYG